MPFEKRIIVKQPPTSEEVSPAGVESLDPAQLAAWQTALNTTFADYSVKSVLFVRGWMWAFLEKEV